MPVVIHVRHVVEHHPGHGVHAQRLRCRGRGQLVHLVVVRVERERDEGLEAARLVLQRPHAQHVVDALLAGLDVAVEHGHVRAHAEAMGRAVDGQPAIRAALVRADLPPHAGREHFGAPARQ
jgi:hypothetical protein